MKKNDITPFVLLVGAVLCITAGLILILDPKLAMELVITVAKVIVSLTAILFLLTFVFGRKQKFLQAGLVYIIAAIVIVFAPKLFASSLSTLFAFIAGFNGVVHLISFITFRRDKVPQWRNRLIFSVVSFLFAYLMLQNPLRSIMTVSVLFGLYLLLLGLTFAADFVRDFLATDFASAKLKPRVYFPLPVFVAAMLPRKVLKSVNELMSYGDAEEVIKDSDYVPSEKPRLEVYLHIGNDVIGKFGHMDICFDDVVYSYGCYDSSTNILMGFISEGTLAVTARDLYMYQSLDIEKKTLIGFGIDVRGEEAEKVRQRIAELQENLVPWKPLSQRDKEAGGTGEGDQFKDPASVLYNNTDAKFYKFSKGPFKTYFSLGSNCVLLVHKLIGSAGAGVLRVNGLVTPGTYYGYLDRLYQAKNTQVVSKTIYRNGECAEQDSIHAVKLPK